MREMDDVTGASRGHCSPIAGSLLPPSGFIATKSAGSPPERLVSLHLSQSFSYSVVSGSRNYPAPDELAAAIVSAAVPEPASMALFGFGLCALAGLQRLRRKNVTN
jgi:hypothetical protein